MHGPVYATADDLAAYLGLSEPPDDADQLLQRASLLVDGLLIGVRYDTDDQQQPTDSDVADALLDATVAQAGYWHLGHGDQIGGSGGYNSVQIGSVSLSGRAAASGAGRVDGRDVAPTTVTALRVAGLLPAAPLVWG